MLHPSYTDLMKVVNKDVEEGATKVVNSRYSIVMANEGTDRRRYAAGCGKEWREAVVHRNQ